MRSKETTVAEEFAQLGELLKADGRLQIDEAKLELSEQILELMEDKGITEAELARRLGKSRAYVNKVLQGTTNFTIKSLVKIGLALESEVKLEFVQSKKDVLEAEIIYRKVEKPIEKPKVISKSEMFNTANNYSISAFNVNKTVHI